MVYILLERGEKCYVYFRNLHSNNNWFSFFFYILLPCVSVGFDEQPYCVQFDIDLEKCFLSLFIIEPTNRHYIKIHGDVSHSQILHCEVLDHLQNFKNLFGK